MNILMSGGSGLIGRALTESLLESGHSVTILSRSPETVAGLPEGVQAAQWDSRTAAGWGHLVNEADAIINLAGESIAGPNPLAGRWTAARKQRIRQSRVDAGRAIVEAVAAAEKKPSVVIQSSAVGYYGAQGDEPIDETHPAGDDFLASVCIEWEDATAPVEAMGVRRVVLRTGVVLSMDGGALPLMVLPFRLVIAGGPLGSGRQWVPWIHLDDQVRAMQFLLEQPDAAGVYNLAAPNPVTNADFSRAIGKVMRRPALMPAPALALKMALGEMATIVLDGQRVIPARLEEAGFSFRYPDVELALRNLL